MDFNQRLKRLSAEKEPFKGDLARFIGVHYLQISRYEEKEATPFADLMTKVSNALCLPSDFLMSVSSDNLANSKLTDKELLN
ncbi:MAG: hypothetical protein COS42_12415 [Flavobacteriales bacterium CG03_land_8_20_14_0_80_35_15]|nr:hypothetical protein [Zetaproteobacteria bacterium]NDK18963.1 hypothetical protein [Flavobacteriales bacterium]OIO08832.1 MAG: hypothetical protein AUJ53_10825 [Flavobacteriaceae bacterium CG1_02_35_72]PIR14681.1 MAG: hypothetical protein COV50_01355 [Flavobacteriales bacterium CG11_big_fil_rev_8_21_14_0_20_35_7]PIV15971.1 MAG: hypothetical protein COS42_12415 [Flavobacteriales bacterium CG03_land_8_20_14_0_80_35_15]PIX06940.1 MAG: hypothetical protein COZ76_06205 [Flavobacteriales bacteriu